MNAKEWCRAHIDALAISVYCSGRSTGRIPKRQEYLLSLNPQVAYLYSLKVIRRRFGAGEGAIARSPEWAVRYARFVLKGRFKAAERSIAREPRWAYEYATKVIGGRLPPGMHERVISMAPDCFAGKYIAYLVAKSSGDG